jgi:phosphopantetheinyl transferase (holo-ACP synthase)
VIHEESGKPSIELNGTFKELADTESWTSIHVSLSHEGDIATAIVIIER